jgi:hypothetical protein
MADRVRQTQEGGGVQAAGDIIVVGIDADTVRDIIASRCDVIRQELTQHARLLIDERFAQFEKRVMQGLVSSEYLPAFADPDFQFNIREALISAVRSGQPKDMDLLVAILAQRAATPESAQLKLVTRRALDIVGQLPDDSLAGLTVLWYMFSLVPQAIASLSEFLAHMNQHLEPLVDNLPSGRRWLDDLSLLDCIRIGVSGWGALKSFLTLLGDKCPGFTCAGIPSDYADELKISIGELAPPLVSLIVEHPLDRARSSLLGSDEGQMRVLAHSAMTSFPHDELRLENVLDELVEANQYPVRLPYYLDLLKDAMVGHDALIAVNEWWKTSPPIDMTPVGIAMAYANLRRLLPDAMQPSIEAYL